MALFCPLRDFFDLLYRWGILAEETVGEDLEFIGFDIEGVESGKNG